MHKNIKEQWLVALRSGEYRQGRGWLNQGGWFCCLGVLCELAVKAGVTEVSIPDPRDSDNPAAWAARYGTSEGTSVAVLPDEVMNWAGLHDGLGTLTCPISDYVKTLTDLNDYAKYSFNQIADIIEEQF